MVRGTVQRGRGRGAAGMWRTGFALPLVVFMVLVAGLTAGLLIDLQSTARLSVNRQVASYRAHHISQGIKELMDQWVLMSGGGGNIEGQLHQDGMAFELGSAGGVSTRVYLADGQGSALRDASGYGGGRGTTAQQVSRMLSELPEGDEELLRSAGPVQVSVNSAPDVVLEAIAVAASNPRTAAAFVQQITSRRRGKKLTAAEITESAQKAGMTPVEVGAVASMLTASPELWRIVVVASGGGASSRQGGLMQLPPGALTLGDKGVIILSWEDLTESGTGQGR